MKNKHKLFSLFLLVPLCLSACADERDFSSISKIEEIASNEDYILGVDLSSIIEVENAGGVFYDFNGKESDIFSVLSESGINYIRIRLWVDPFDEDGNSFEGGGNDLETDLEIAKRASEAGMKVLLDFHYSDFWADPGKQIIPRAWEGQAGEELYRTASEYTTSVLEAFNEVGATPSMVQIGNEINNEWICSLKGEEFYSFVGECASAVRSYDPSIEIALHLAMDQSINTLVSSFNGFISHDIDFDIIGLSYYPYWHGSLSTLDSNLSKLEESFDKKICIMEYAYGYTLDSSEMSFNTSNIFNKSCERNGGYEATPTGQALCIYDINKTISSHKSVIGSFYWEPAWLGLEGTSWASSDAFTYQRVNGLDTNGLGTCSWVNQALFDYNGYPLESLKTYNIMKGIS
ncbi:MAG: glycosyl hydrolase 53 family protein [Coprobacillus sp.]|nr:glycosyl hydrolase 53 family protein [Coprobacillus sp.]